MTLATSASSATFNGSGGTGPFTFNFRFFSDTDIVVTKNVSGVSSLLIKGINYTITGAGSYAGGSVTLTAALNTGEILTIRRTLALTQLTSIRNQAAFYPEIHEDVFDRLTMEIQQVNELATSSSVVVSTVTVGTRTDFTSDATAAPTTVNINGLTEVTVTKNDATANTVTIQDSSGATILRQSTYTLYLLDEWVHLLKAGNNWKRIG